MSSSFPTRQTVRLSLSLVLAGVISSAAPGWASTSLPEVQSQPSLAEVARKEAERRKTAKDAKKVITAKDLPESARKPVVPPTTAEAGAAQTGEPKPSSTPPPGAPAADDNKGEEYWRGRITQARESLRRNGVFLDALQNRVNGLTADASRDDPYQRATIVEDRQKALAEIERVKADIELSKKQIADIEEEARKAGVPPGWLR
jgi:hypothetical protein